MDVHIILGWIDAYGYAGLFGLLLVGVFGLPVPDETLLLLAGYMAHKGTLDVVPALATAFAGSACGVTLSFGLGQALSFAVLRRHAGWLHLTPEKLQRMRAWFKRKGRWALLFGYFLPGVRHLTALLAGTTKLGFGTFAAFAYSGALLWTATFVLLGFFLGEEWEKVYEAFHRHLLVAALVAGAAAAVYYFVIRPWMARPSRR